MIPISVFRYAIGYAVCLSIWSLALVYSNTYLASGANGILGFAVLAVVYFYLDWSLKRLFSNSSVSKQKVVLSGIVIAVVGCLLSTTSLWFYNECLGFTNRITNSIRALAVHALYGLVMSLYISTQITYKTEE